MNDLLSRAFDEELSEADERALAELLKSDEAAALRYLELARDEALLAEAVVEARAVRALEAPSRSRWLVAAALLIAAGTLFLAPTPSTPPRPAAGTGLRAEYFDRPDLTEPRATRIDSFLDFHWTSGSPDPAVAPGSWSARWSGTLRPRTSGPHTFHLTADDGVRLWIGDRLLIDHWKEQTRTERAGSTLLEAGVTVPIRLEYFNLNGPGALRLTWSGPSFPKETVPPDVLFR
ncbi:MAG TPA: PA14 domain-containing protein [Planctomycetota bacterium]